MIRAEDLIALAAAHRVDLTRVASNATDTRRHPRRRRTKRELLQGLEIADTADGRDTRIARPHWSLPDLGMAAAGVPQLYFLAARFAFARDDGVYWQLWHELHFQAARIARREGWRAQVRNVNGEPRYYLSELAELVLIEDRYASYFRAAPVLYSAFLHIEDDLWERKLAKRFRAVQEKYELWILTALSMIESNLRAAVEEEAVA